MKVAEKKKVNKAVGVVVDPTYFNEIPLADIMGAIEGLGYLVVDEEHNRWSGFLCGREGQAMFDILSKETGKLDNSNRTALIDFLLEIQPDFDTIIIFATSQEAKPSPIPQIQIWGMESGRIRPVETDDAASDQAAG